MHSYLPLPGTRLSPRNTMINKSPRAPRLLEAYGPVGELDMNQIILEIGLDTCGLTCMTMPTHYSLNYQKATIFGIRVCNSSWLFSLVPAPKNLLSQLYDKLVHGVH